MALVVCYYLSEIEVSSSEIFLSAEGLCACLADKSEKCAHLNHRNLKFNRARSSVLHLSQDNPPYQQRLQDGSSPAEKDSRVLVEEGLDISQLCSELHQNRCDQSRNKRAEQELSTWIRSDRTTENGFKLE